jgi:hypothetical protein
MRLQDTDQMMDNNDDHPINGETESKETNDDNNVVEGIDLRKTTMTEYIQQKFKAGDGTNLFAKVYQPAGGIIACLIDPYHNNEAKSLFRVLTGEIARDMCYDSMATALALPNEAREAATFFAQWKPFTLSTKIGETNPTITPRKKPTTERVKRYRQGRSNVNPLVSFAKAAAASIPSKDTATTVSPLTSQGQPDETATNEVWDKLQSQINDLKTAHEQMQADQKATNANVTKSRQATAKAIVNLEEKYDVAVNDMQTMQTTSENKLLSKIEESTACSVSIQEYMMQCRREDKEEKVRDKKEKEQAAIISREDRERAQLQYEQTEMLMGNFANTPGANVTTPNRSNSRKSSGSEAGTDVTNTRGSKNQAVASPKNAEGTSFITGRKKSRVTEKEFFSGDIWGDENHEGMDYSSTDHNNKENDLATQDAQVVDKS